LIGPHREGEAPAEPSDYDPHRFTRAPIGRQQQRCASGQNDCINLASCYKATSERRISDLPSKGNLRHQLGPLCCWTWRRPRVGLPGPRLARSANGLPTCSAGRRRASPTYFEALIRPASPVPDLATAPTWPTILLILTATPLPAILSYFPTFRRGQNLNKTASSGWSLSWQPIFPWTEIP